MSRYGENERGLGPHLVDIFGPGTDTDPGFDKEFRPGNELGRLAQRCYPEASGPEPGGRALRDPAGRYISSVEVRAAMGTALGSVSIGIRPVAEPDAGVLTDGAPASRSEGFWLPPWKPLRRSGIAGPFGRSALG
jgi:hypothetical protein